MRRSSARRAQTEPFAALVAVAVVALALATFAGVFEASVPAPVDRNLAEPAADSVERNLTAGGVVRPDYVENRTGRGPDGYDVNVTLEWGDGRETNGPTAPDTADVASRRVSVFLGDADVVPGRLEVRVWT